MNPETNANGTVSAGKRKKMNQKRKDSLRKIMIHGILIILSGLFIFPFLWMVSTALKGAEGLFEIPPRLIPAEPLWSNFPKALTTIPFIKYAGNTIFITVMVIIGAVSSSTISAYSFARLKWKGRDVWFMIMLATMMLPGIVTMIPVFVIFSKLKWINTFLPLIVPAFFASAFNVFLLRQFFKTIPMELAEAAKIDGCREFGIFLRIFVPLCKPAVLTIAVFTFMNTWNDFFGPLIYLNDSDKFTLALGLRSFQQRFLSQWNLMMAAAIVVMSPTLIVFFLFQKVFIEGITLTGIKG